MLTVVAPGEVSLRIFVGHKHECVGYYSAGCARRETPPKSHPASFVLVYVLCTFDKAAVRDDATVLLEANAFLILLNLKFCLDQILRVGGEPCEEASYSSCK